MVVLFRSSSAELNQKNVNYDEPKYRFLCGKLHVTTGTYLFGFFGIFSAFFQLFVPSLPVVINGCISLGIYLCLIGAEQRLKPWLYLPFLIVEGIKLVALWLLEILLTIYWLCLLFCFVHADVGANSDRAMFDQNTDFVHLALAAMSGLGTLAMSFILIVTTISLAFFQWIYVVVWRAYQFRRRELTNQLPTSATKQVQTDITGGTSTASVGSQITTTQTGRWTVTDIA